MTGAFRSRRTRYPTPRQRNGPGASTWRCLDVAMILHGIARDRLPATRRAAEGPTATAAARDQRALPNQGTDAVVMSRREQIRQKKRLWPARRPEMVKKTNDELRMPTTTGRSRCG